MKYSKNRNIYVIRLMHGEEVIQTLWNFCKEKGISGGYFSGIGAAEDLLIGIFDPATKKYIERKFSGSGFEILNLTGNVTDTKLHVHITFADKDGKAYGGHLISAVVDPTVEIFLVPLDKICRKKDEYSGLELMDL